jgi:hypothetical protein
VEYVSLAMITVRHAVDKRAKGSSSTFASALDSTIGWLWHHEGHDANWGVATHN